MYFFVDLLYKSIFILNKCMYKYMYIHTYQFSWIFSLLFKSQNKILFFDLDINWMWL